MQILNSENTPFFNKKNCIALGNFDGIHTGHRSIIKSAIDYALNNGFCSCVYTFSTPPSHILGTPKTILTDNDEKCRIFGNLGCDWVYFENFSDVLNMTPAQFCKRIIAEKLNATAVFCGENYRFGKCGTGTIAELTNELSKLGISVFVMPYEYFDGEIISSTEIRRALTDGECEKAVRMLGHPYSISGTVLHGKQLGRRLGFPTLNITIPSHKTVPKYGVYFSTCELFGKTYRAVSNIGIRPTTDDVKTSSVNCETFLFDFDSNVYGQSINVNLYKMKRSEKAFSSVSALKNQVDTDISDAAEFFKLHKTEIFYNA